MKVMTNKTKRFNARPSSKGKNSYFVNPDTTTAHRPAQKLPDKKSDSPQNVDTVSYDEIKKNHEEEIRGRKHWAVINLIIGLVFIVLAIIPLVLIMLKPIPSDTPDPKNYFQIILLLLPLLAKLCFSFVMYSFALFFLKFYKENLAVKDTWDKFKNLASKLLFLNVAYAEGNETAQTKILTESLDPNDKTGQKKEGSTPEPENENVVTNLSDALSKLIQKFLPQK